MNIVQILPALKEGGVETGTIDLCKYLKEQSHTVYVISSGGPLVSQLKDNNISHFFWPVHKKNPWTIFQTTLRLIQFIRRHHIDIVHARSRVPGWIAYFACKITKTKWVTTCHGYYQKHFGSRVMGWADQVIVATHAIGQHMEEDFGVSSSKIAFIPRGVDLNQFVFSPPALSINEATRSGLNEATRSGLMTPIIGYVGRISPIKGLKDFIRALGLLKKEHVKFKSRIIGEATNLQYLNELKTLIRELNLTSDIEFLGHQDNIAEQLKSIHILVLPTTYPEAFGRVIVEAQAVGVAVIGTRVGGIQEVIEDGITGLLCSAHHPAELAQCIKKILKDPFKTQTMIHQARKKVETHYGLSQMVQKTEQVYKDLLKSKILVIKFSSLGDVILISASLRHLRQKFESHGAHITLLTSKESKPIVEHCPHIDELWTVSKREFKNLYSTLQDLRQKRFTHSIDFQNTTQSHALAFFAGIPHRYGFKRKAGFLFLNHIAQDSPMPPIHHQFQILNLLNIRLKDSQLEFWLHENDRRHLEELLRRVQIDIHQPFWVIHIGASWETKRWKAKYIAQICEHIYRTKKVPIILTGTKNDLPFEMEIRFHLTVPVTSLVGKTTIRELAALIEKSAQLISADSAPLHMAAAFQKPTLALFGPTDPKRHAPPSSNMVILNEKVDCGPCYKSSCSHHSCMVNLTPDKALKALETHKPS